MLANGLGVPIGALGGQLAGWRGVFWALAVLVTTALTVIATAGICLFSTQPVPTLLLFTLLGLVGLSANPILVAIAARFGGKAPTLATAMPTSIFNLGTAIGTGISAAALESPLSDLGPPTVGIIAALIFIPPSVLALRERRVRLATQQPTQPQACTVPRESREPAVSTISRPERTETTSEGRVKGAVSAVTPVVEVDAVSAVATARSPSHTQGLRLGSQAGPAKSNESSDLQELGRAVEL
jgi:hypothetical protein